LDLRVNLKDCLQESAVTTSNVHNGGDTAGCISKDNSIAQHSSQARHALVERAGSIGILVQTFEQSCTEYLVKGWGTFLNSVQESSAGFVVNFAEGHYDRL
jgi:hypothetical protein